MPLLSRIRLVGAGSFLLFAVIGCKKQAESTPTVSNNPAPTPTAAPSVVDGVTRLAEADIVGTWAVTSVTGGSGSDAIKSIVKNLKSAKFWFRADHSVIWYSDENAAYPGYWSLTDKGVEITHDKGKPAFETLAVKGRQLQSEMAEIVSLFDRITTDVDKPDTQLTVDQFQSQTQTDRAKYAGKLVEITGVVHEVDTDIEGAPYLLLASAAGPSPTTATSFSKLLMSAGVQCYTVDQAIYGRLAPDQTVTLRGVGFTGGGLGPDLLGCYVVKSGPPTMIETTADALSAEYTRDPAVANSKYNGDMGAGKTFLITGTVLSTTTDDHKGVFVGTEKAKVFCEIAPMDEKAGTQLKLLKPGQTVKIVGRYSVQSYRGLPDHASLIGCEIIPN